MKLPRFAIRNHQFTILAFTLLLIMGIKSFLTMPRSENPTIYVPGGTVYVVYPGANPQDLEQLVAFPLEGALNELEDIEQIQTDLKDGLAVISVEFSYDTDAEKKFEEVIRQVNSVKNDLPSEIIYLDVMEWSSSDLAMIQLAFIADTVSFARLEYQADQLKRRIEKTAGVKRVEILAVPAQEIRISLDIEKMAGMNISITQVAQAIQSNNANIPGGSVKLDGKSFGIKTSGSYKNLEELRNTVVHSYLGKLIHLKHIATVEYDYEDNNYYARFNGQRCIFLTIHQKEDLDVIDLAGQIKPLIANFQRYMPEEIRLEYVFDQSEVIKTRISGFMSNLIQGIALVGIIVLLSLGLRSSLIVILAIPMSILVGLSFVDMAGFGLQQISIAALVVALGLLVDNSIVVVENIRRFIRLGYNPGEAAGKGASQIGWPIFSATLTTLLAFVPIIMMPDKAGDFIKSLPVTLIATLSVSLFLALSLTPLAGSLMFRDLKGTLNGRSDFFQRFLKRIIEGPYRKVLDFSIRRKAVVLSLAFLILAGSVVMFPLVGISFFPPAETPEFMIRALLPEGSNIDRTDRVARDVEAVLASMTQVDHFATNVGHGNPRIYYNIFSKNYALNFAEIYVKLKEYNSEDYRRTVEELRQQFVNYPGAKITVKEYMQGVPSDAPIMVYVHGEDVDVLTGLAREVQEILETIPGPINIDNQLDISRTDIHFNINKEKAGIFGVPVVEIDRAIRTAISGMEIGSFRNEEGEEFKIVIRLPVNERVQLQDFQKIFVRSLSGRFIPLYQLATMEFREAPGIVSRYNLERSGLIKADLTPDASLDEVLDELISQLEMIRFPDNYDYWIGGELENRTESFGGMKHAVLLALIAIFAVLVLQFKSFVQPIIIFVAIPLAMIGSIWALFITGYTFSFTAFIGAASLVGIVVNNSIILVDYTNILRKEGLILEEALKKAGETRFTPILLTTLTTIGGLLPLTLRGGELWAPMGWTIIGGLLVSTLLTLIVVPVFYRILTRG
ncbi:MAG: efflux RND transporter permease subunit [Bacteroidales bacterium]|nr:MAG: efflux RND transporter permease subunit [Bacteroidales bacterium]